MHQLAASAAIVEFHVGQRGYIGEGTIGLPVGPSVQLSAPEYGAFLGR